MPNPHPICAQLREFRNKAGLSLERVEQKTGGAWKAVVVGSYERGNRQPTVARADELLRFYGERLVAVPDSSAAGQYVIVHTDRRGEQRVHDIRPDADLGDVQERAVDLERSAHGYGRTTDTYRVFELRPVPTGGA